MKTKNQKRILFYIGKVKRELTKSLTSLAFLTALQLSGPIIVAKIVDEKLPHLNEPGVLNSIFYSIGIFVAIGFLQSLVRYFTNLSFMKTANNVAIYLREDLFKHVQSLPMKYFDNISAGKVVSRITNDTNALKQLFQTALSQILTSGFYILAALLILLFKKPAAALFILVPIPILYFIIRFYDRKSRVLNRDYRRSLSQINSDINENIKGMEVIRTFNVEDGVQREFEKISEENYNTGIKMDWLDSFINHNSTQTLSNINVLIILFAFGYANIKGAQGFSIGFMYILLNYTERIYSAANQIIQRLGDIEKSLAAADHIFEIFDMETEFSIENKNAKIKGDVEFKDVSFYYKKDNYVLKNITFNVPSGSSVALVGQTGSGKSSIINLLFRFYKEISGEILIDGKNINEYSLGDLRSEMAIVLQEPFIYKTTLRENITLGLDFSDEEIKNALFSVGGENLYRNLDKGLDTKISEGGSGLSQGEKQIITFARAIIKNPKILVLDEATSSIDSETESYIQLGLNKLKEGRTTFIIAHRLSTIKNVDNILVLSYGKIMESGNHETLMQKKSMYYDMVMKENKSLN